MQRKIQELQSKSSTRGRFNSAISIFNLSILYKDPYIIVSAYTELKRRVPAYQLTLEDFVIVCESSICTKDKDLADSLIVKRASMLKKELSAEEEQRLTMMHNWRFAKIISAEDILTTRLNSKYYPWLDNYMRATACEQLESYDKAKVYYLDALSTMPEEWTERKIIYLRYESL